MAELEPCADANPASSPIARCACKGIRVCRLCSEAKQLPLVAQPALPLQKTSSSSSTTLHFCLRCQAIATTTTTGDGVGDCRQAEHLVPSTAVDLLGPGAGLANGIRVHLDFINKAEEADLIAEIDGRPWVASQSGRRKQDYGPKVNFRRRRLNPASFSGLPPYWRRLLPRLLALPGLADFRPVELCNLDYRPELAAHIDPHIDDTWLWGERLVTLNLASGTVLTLTPASPAAGGAVVRIPMPPRSVLALSGAARYDWLHAVLPDDVTERRLAVTLRELASDWLAEPAGLRLLEAGATFDGVSVAELQPQRPQ